MDFEFDNEIDVLLRQAARSDDFASNKTSGAHLDADEISAFAENALPEKTRAVYTAHLADCGKCRKILSNLILLDSETESEIVHAGKAKQFAAAATLPWYRKLVAFPNLAYTLGALVLVFSGIAVFTVLQSVSDSRNAEVSQISEKQTGGKGMSSDGETAAVESVSNRMMSNSASSNMSFNSSASNTSSASVPGLAMPAAPLMNANAAADKDSAGEAKPSKSKSEPVDLAEADDSIVAGAAPPPPPKENNQPQTEAEKQQVQNNAQQQNNIAQNQTQIAPDSQNVRRSAPSAKLESRDKKLADESKNDAAGMSGAAATTVVGGKTFRRENNVWYDTAYRGQATTNVARGTKEYKKLDSGLRGIVERIGGTVVIVWKEKAYRIQ